MDFAWEADKDAENQATHDISFEEATHIFDGPSLTKIDDAKITATYAKSAWACFRLRRCWWLSIRIAVRQLG